VTAAVVSAKDRYAANICLVVNLLLMATCGNF